MPNNEEETVIDGVECITHKWFVKGCPYGYAIAQRFTTPNCSLEFNPKCVELCG